MHLSLLWMGALTALLAIASGCEDDFEAGAGSPSSAATGASGPVGPGAGGGGRGTGGMQGAGAGPASSSSAAGGGVSEHGCADGQREGYFGEPRIAACAGGFLVAGVTTGPSMQPQCLRQGGDDGPNPTGTGCSVADLCAEGWHVCNSAPEVASEVSACPTDSVMAPPVFWLTRQSTDNSVGDCTALGDNNLVGCGEGLAMTMVVGANCGPLDTLMYYSSCAANPPWYCGTGMPEEALVVTKNGSDLGGVLCCQE